jgi:hypothetical protein
MRHRQLIPLLIVSLVAMLSGCSSDKADEKLLESTLENYASVIRWGNFEDAVAYIDPAALKEHPISALDLARYRQVRVTAYNEQPFKSVGELQVRQVVEVGIVNNNTQVMRSLTDRQLWRFDVKEKRWWLMTGLPDITQH